MITRPRALVAEPSSWLAALIFCGLCALAWFSYRATEQWQRGAALRAEHRGREAADLLTRALTRDMAGVQTSILNSPEQNRRQVQRPTFVAEQNYRAREKRENLRRIRPHEPSPRIGKDLRNALRYERPD